MKKNGNKGREEETNHSVIFVNIAAIKPKMLKFNSNELHNARPSIIGTKLILVQKPVISPIIKWDMMTVNIGDEDIIVSTNDIEEYLSAIRQSKIESILKSIETDNVVKN